MLELRDLREFAAVATELNFSRAARRLYISQSVLSVRIQKLERTLGVRLFWRTTRSVTLTPAGEAFLQRARETLAAADQAVAAARAAAAGQSGRLRIGWLGPGAGELTPSILEAFAELRPDVALETQVCDYVTVLSSVRDGLTDINFLHLPYSERELMALNVVPLLSETRVAALPRGHRLAGRDSIRFEEIADEMYLDEVETVSRTWRDFWLVADRHRNPPRVSSYRAATVEEFLHIVARGEGIHTTPASVARYFARPDVAFVPVPDIPPCVIALAWRRSNSDPLIAQFVATAKRIVDQTEHDRLIA